MELRKFFFNWVLLRNVFCGEVRATFAYYQRCMYSTDKHPLCCPIGTHGTHRHIWSFTALLSRFIEQFPYARPCCVLRKYNLESTR